MTVCYGFYLQDHHLGELVLGLSRIRSVAAQMATKKKDERCDFYNIGWWKEECEGLGTDEATALYSLIFDTLF